MNGALLMQFTKLDNAVKNALERGAFPGAVCAVGDKNGLLFKKAYGHTRIYSDDAPCFDLVPSHIPDGLEKMSFDTMFDMASCSKILSPTMIALKLIEDGELTLYDSISRFVDVPDDKQEIELRHLLTHTSGIKAHFLLEKLTDDPKTAAQTILAQPLSSKVGTKVEYTCMGYILLGRILEKVCGKPLDELADEYVFSPLGMKDTCYNPKTKGYKKFAVTEYSEDLKRYKCGEVHDENAYFLGGVSANAGVFSTIDDAVKFALMLSRRGMNGEKVYLSSATFDMASRDYTEWDEEHRGIGFSLKGSNSISAMGDLYAVGSYGHNGFTGTSIYVDKATSFFMVLLTNRVHYTRGNILANRYRRAFHNVALAEYCTFRTENKIVYEEAQL